MIEKKQTHDDLMLQLCDDKLLIKIFSDKLKYHFGEKSVWSRFHWVLDKEVDEWNKKDKIELYTCLIKSKMLESVVYNKHCKDKSNCFIHELDKCFTFFDDKIKIILTSQKDNLEKSSFEDNIKVKKNFEVPIIKGEGKYKTTKGFIDLIVVFSSVDVCSVFYPFKNNEEITFIVEIKKESDFDTSTGQILRQIKEYREYYKDNIDSKFGIISDKIPKRVRNLFSNEDIFCIELKENPQ